MPRKIPRLVWLAAPLAYFLYFYRLGAVGMIGPDEPRYAAIGRAMARSGDWITPRLWGHPWFEKPPLLYWMTGAAFRLGLGPDLAPRLPVAILALAFLVFFWWIVRREFGARAAWCAALILGTCGEWLGYSQVGVTDIPMAVTFSAAMLLLLPWIARGETKFVPLAGALLGVAVLAKGLVPIALAAPAIPVICWRKRKKNRIAPGATGFAPTQKNGVEGPPPGPNTRPLLGAAALFLIIAAPWYLLCYLRNGSSFLNDFFWKQHFSRVVSGALMHGQPWWFYLPVFLGAFLPWSPLLPLLFKPAGYRDTRRVFLLLWLLFGLGFFSVSINKLPGYVVPLLPAAALLAALGLDGAPRAGAWLAVCAALLLAFPVAAQVLPAALALGLSKASHPGFRWWWLVLGGVMAASWLLEQRGRRVAAVACIAAGAAAGVVYLKQTTLPEVDRVASARDLWRAIAGRASDVCVDGLDRDWLYGLNYYSVDPLPECSIRPRPLRLRPSPGGPPVIAALGDSGNATVDPVSPNVVPSPFRN